MQAATQAATQARNAPLRARAKGVAADLVTDADAKAEHAAVSVIRAARPDDAIIGEEGTDDAGAGARRWYVDGIDGTVGFAAGMPGSWCSAVVLTDADGPLACAAHNPAGELYAAARGQGATLNGEPLTFTTAPKPLERANVAIFLRQDRLVLPGVRETAHAVIDRDRDLPPRRPGHARAGLGRRRPPRRLDSAGDRPVGLAPRPAADRRSRRNDPHRPQGRPLARGRAVVAG